MLHWLDGGALPPTKESPPVSPPVYPSTLPLYQQGCTMSLDWMSAQTRFPNDSQLDAQVLYPEGSFLLNQV